MASAGSLCVVFLVTLTIVSIMLMGMSAMDRSRRRRGATAATRGVPGAQDALRGMPAEAAAQASAALRAAMASVSGTDGGSGCVSVTYTPPAPTAACGWSTTTIMPGEADTTASSIETGTALSWRERRVGRKAEKALRREQRFIEKQERREERAERKIEREAAKVQRRLEKEARCTDLVEDDGASLDKRELRAVAREARHAVRRGNRDLRAVARAEKRELDSAPKEEREGPKDDDSSLSRRERRRARRAVRREQKRVRREAKAAEKEAKAEAKDERRRIKAETKAEAKKGWTWHVRRLWAKDADKPERSCTQKSIDDHKRREGVRAWRRARHLPSRPTAQPGRIDMAADVQPGETRTFRGPDVECVCRRKPRTFRCKTCVDVIRCKKRRVVFPRCVSCQDKKAIVKPVVFPKCTECAEKKMKRNWRIRFPKCTDCAQKQTTEKEVSVEKATVEKATVEKNVKVAKPQPRVVRKFTPCPPRPQPRVFVACCKGCKAKPAPAPVAQPCGCACACAPAPQPVPAPAPEKPTCQMRSYELPVPQAAPAESELSKTESSVSSQSSQSVVKTESAGVSSQTATHVYADADGREHKLAVAVTQSPEGPSGAQVMHVRVREHLVRDGPGGAFGPAPRPAPIARIEDVLPGAAGASDGPVLRYRGRRYRCWASVPRERAVAPATFGRMHDVLVQGGASDATVTLCVRAE